MSTYSAKLKHPNWQKKRLEILQRDNFQCQSCSEKEKTLNVHHKVYFQDKDIWDIDPEFLITLCEDCHKEETEQLKLVKQSFFEAFFKHDLSSKNLLDLAIAFYDLKSTVHPEHLIWAIDKVFNNKELQEKLLLLYYPQDIIDELKKDPSKRTE